MQTHPPAINNPALSTAERLEALKTHAGLSAGKINATDEVNNHIHTIYSFSPYTPSMAALLARDAGLSAAGSVDHDSIAAAGEMLSACSILGIGGCAGFELRVSFKTQKNGSHSRFSDKKLNNPDSAGNAYVTVQGIPEQHISRAEEFLLPIRRERLKRTREMTDLTNTILSNAGFSEINFDNDIFQQSKYSEGGSITERHLLAAAAKKIMEKFSPENEPDRKTLIDELKSKLNITVPASLYPLLSNPQNPHYLYDLLGLLKSELLPQIYIEPNEDECIPAPALTAFADSISAVSSYAYLGDVGDSPTGDKKAEKFEDDFLEELFTELKLLGFRAISYMPPRNTRSQLLRVSRLCREYGFMEISGVDINSPRQSFNCPEVLHKDFRHLLDSTWALIAHQRLASQDESKGLFSQDNPLSAKDINDRIKIYSELGKKQILII